MNESQVVGSSGRRPYGGRPHQSHCSCFYRVADMERLRTAWQAMKEAMWQGDTEQAIALMTMDDLIGVNADGSLVDAAESSR